MLWSVNKDAGCVLNSNYTTKYAVRYRQTSCVVWMLDFRPEKVSAGAHLKEVTRKDYWNDTREWRHQRCENWTAVKQRDWDSGDGSAGSSPVAGVKCVRLNETVANCSCSWTQNDLLNWVLEKCRKASRCNSNSGTLQSQFYWLKFRSIKAPTDRKYKRNKKTKHKYPTCF